MHTLGTRWLVNQKTLRHTHITQAQTNNGWASYGREVEAISSALHKKLKGAVMVRVVNSKTLNERELQRLLDFVKTTKSAARNRAILLLTHLAGMRIGEVAAVRVCDVLASDGTVREEINLSAAQTKGNKSRSVLLSERMQAELTAYLRTVRVRDPKQALFATQRSAAFTANSLTQVVNGIYKHAGLDGASSHSGRRGFLTNLAEKGVSVRVMMALAGHANMATTQRYIDLRPGVLRNAVELV